MTVYIASGRYAEARTHAWEAVRLYAAHHPAFPRLAHDVAFMLAAEGFYASTIPVFEKSLPFFSGSIERMSVLASLAKAAAAVRDRLRFERAATEALALVEHAPTAADSALYNLGEGARFFEQWDRARSLAERSLLLAATNGNKSVVRLATDLLKAAHAHDFGAGDQIPETGGEIDQLVELVLRRLRKHTAPHDRRAVAPERFPIL